MRKQIIIVSILIIISIVGGVGWEYYQNGKQEQAVNNTEQTGWKWGLFTSQNGRFSVQVPWEWETKEMTDNPDFITRAVITATSENKLFGTTKEIDITQTSKPEVATALNSQKQFDYWHDSVGTESASENIYKLDNTEIDGLPAVILTSESKTEGVGMDEWYTVVWFRKANDNFYINYRGKGKFADEDVALIRFMLSTFKFL